MVKQEIIRAIQTAQQLLVRQARNRYEQFVLYTDDSYKMTWFHRVICDHLNEFEKGNIKKLMILMPPQHGKTELATRKFPAYLLGKDPSRKIAVTNYSHSIVAGFNRSIQRNIDNELYGSLFPETRLNYSKIFSTNYDNYTRNEDKFEVVKHGGFVRTVSRGGSLTSESVDIGIIDDLYKDREEAKSMTVSESAWNWYVDVFKTRLHNNSQQLIMNTRWDENDLAGRLLLEEPGQWVVLKFPAIKTQDINEYDNRKEGEALWPEKHSLEKILSQKALSEGSYNSLYQQDPKPNKDILIFTDWIEVPAGYWPEQADLATWGLDFGKTTGINALVKMVETPADSDSYKGNIYYKETLYERDIPPTEIAKLLKDSGYRDGEIVWCDHMPQKISDLRLQGIAAFPAIKGQGSVQSGIDLLKEYRIHYTADSSNIKMETNKYQWVTYGKVITTVPVDDFNHIIDACRYAKTGKYFRGR